LAALGFTKTPLPPVAYVSPSPFCWTGRGRSRHGRDHHDDHNNTCSDEDQWLPELRADAANAGPDTERNEKEEDEQKDEDEAHHAFLP
jgi:hypothetical protein